MAASSTISSELHRPEVLRAVRVNTELLTLESRSIQSVFFVFVYPHRNMRSPLLCESGNGSVFSL